MEIEGKERNLVWIIRRSFSEGETTVSYVTAVIVLSKFKLRYEVARHRPDERRFWKRNARRSLEKLPNVDHND